MFDVTHSQGETEPELMKLNKEIITQKDGTLRDARGRNARKRISRNPIHVQNDTPKVLNRPTRADLLAAACRTVPDVIAPDLQVLFCGINPGLYTAWAGHHFARPGNRFWPALFASGFTKRLLRPEEERDLLLSGYGITNLVSRATVAADELGRQELVDGAETLRRKVAEHRPKCVAILGLSAYRLAFERPKTRFGLQPEKLGRTLVWVLPNPSGLNAHFTPRAFAEVFRELRANVCDAL